MKVENLKIYGLENSFRVSHFPKAVDTSKCTERYTETICKLGSAKRGSGHDNFLKGIVVQFDLTCTIKMWTEAERYHWFDIVSSQSTMHKIAEMDLDKCMTSWVTQVTIDNLKVLQDIFRKSNSEIDYLNLLYNVPVGLELTAGITTNYQQLKTIYAQRKKHLLPEWQGFCCMIKTLPYMKDFLKLEGKA